MIDSLIIALAEIAGALCAVPEVSPLHAQIGSEQCVEWVDSVYASLSERQRVGQLIIAHVTPDPSAGNKAAVKRLTEEDGVGGFLFSKGSLSDYAEMVNYAQSYAKVPLMMTFDGEWGLSMRIDGTPRFPYNMGLGAIQDERLIYDYGMEMARECKALGIQVNFAPVLDVNSNPSNPVIGTRSFGEDPARVAKLGTAYALGLESGGVLSTSKHFPGHGDTDVDSHKALPTLKQTRRQLESVDFVPFEEYSRAKLGGVMVGHIAVPSLDSTLTPASLSRPITTGVLKEQLGFEGLIFTDALGMKGAATDGNACVEALKAGADMLLSPINARSDLDAVMKAIEDGEISKEQVEASVRKLLSYKYALGLSEGIPVDQANVGAVINSPEADALNTALANASITVIRNESHILPISDLAHNKIAVVNVGASSGNAFDNLCRQYADAAVFDGGNLTATELDRLKKFNTVVVAVYDDKASSVAAMQKLADMPGLVPVFLINPYKVTKFKQSLGGAKAIMLAYDDTPYTRRAAAMGLFAGINVDGRVPVNIEGVAKTGEGVSFGKTRLGYASPYSVGMNPSLTAKIDSIMAEAVEKGATPGGQVLVARNGEIVVNKNYGKTTKGGKPVNDFTLYDLASVSKTVGTLPGVMKAYDLGLFEMDAFAKEYIPGLNVAGKDSITPRMLLYHESGMQPSLPMFDIMMDTLTYTGNLLSSKYDKNHKIKVYRNLYGNQNAKMRTDIASRTRGNGFEIEAAKGLYLNDAAYDTIMNKIYASKLRANRDYTYSCLNFCLLMDMEQRVTGQGHDQWVTDSVWAPIGAYGFRYRPTLTAEASDIAATENDTYLRKQHLQGYVHDELAAFSGGLQGNAGVFGTATDIAKLCQTWLNDGTYGGERIFSEETTNLFTDSKSPNSHRGLGFDKPYLENPDYSSTVARATPSTYGHTGYTGTVFWVDPEYDLIFVFLNNRVDPTRNNDAWLKVAPRSALMNAVYDSLGL
ncbi:MAG: serine hydrolase [Clostridium sp.]|nr:serine hydrolase [Clostridium sp.]